MSSYFLFSVTVGFLGPVGQIVECDSLADLTLACTALVQKYISYAKLNN